jgi:bifunctional DNase/RNase
MIEVKIDAIRISMMGTRVVILKEIDAPRALPIYIGETEANSISIQLQGLQVARPITHDLIVSMIREMEASVRHVLVYDMQDNTYFARIVLSDRAGKELTVDSRPSDAIAIAVRLECPIYVEDEIMSKYGQSPDEEPGDPREEDLGAFKDFLGSLDLDDLDKK